MYTHFNGKYLNSFHLFQSVLDLIFFFVSSTCWMVFFSFLLMLKPNITTNSIDILYILALFITLFTSFLLFALYPNSVFINFTVFEIVVCYVYKSMCFWSAFNCVTYLFLWCWNYSFILFSVFVECFIVWRKRSKKEKNIFSKK